MPHLLGASDPTTRSNLPPKAADPQICWQGNTFVSLDLDPDGKKYIKRAKLLCNNEDLCDCLEACSQVPSTPACPKYTSKAWGREACSSRKLAYTRNENGKQDLISTLSFLSWSKVHPRASFSINYSTGPCISFTLFSEWIWGVTGISLVKNVLCCWHSDYLRWQHSLLSLC